MIEPGELHRFFIVREIATGREWWLLNNDVRYEAAENRTPCTATAPRLTANTSW